MTAKHHEAETFTAHGKPRVCLDVLHRGERLRFVAQAQFHRRVAALVRPWLAWLWNRIARIEVTVQCEWVGCGQKWWPPELPRGGARPECGWHALVKALIECQSDRMIRVPIQVRDAVPLLATLIEAHRDCCVVERHREAAWKAALAILGALPDEVRTAMEPGVLAALGPERRPAAALVN